jgi:predicted acylesterase/phospholipase RssA
MTSSDTSMRAAATEVARDASPVELKSRSARPPKAVHAPQVPPLRKSHRDLERPPFHCIALVLQGGGALGAFQAGVYQAMVEANLQPEWVSGISIGAINTPLQWVVSGDTRQDTLTFQVDLWNARGEVPSGLTGVMVRQKEIQYSSRTRANTGALGGGVHRRRPHVASSGGAATPHRTDGSRDVRSRHQWPGIARQGTPYIVTFTDEKSDFTVRRKDRRSTA